ncbi:MAG: CRTAC1 family protein [Planctomycetota bacterium]
MSRSPSGPAPIALRPLLLLLLSGCGGEDSHPPPVAPPAAGGPADSLWFRERSREAGLDFEHRIGEERRYHLPETVAGGGALLDVDGDGDLDLLLVQGGDLLDPDSPSSDRLFRNDGALRFTDITEGSGLDAVGYGIGVCTGDIDLDGDVDLYITRVGRNTLYRNDGEGRFTDITEESGAGDAAFGTSAAMGDLDGDGLPEIFAANYVRWSPERELPCTNEDGTRDYCAPNNYRAPAPDLLLRNRGGARFEDVSERAGLRVAFGNGLGVVFADLDGDRRPDIAVANDGNPNQLWLNRSTAEGLRFEEVATRRGAAVDMNGRAEAGMGIVAFDAEGDGDLDLLLTHLRNETNTFYRNDGGSFTDATVLTGLAGPSRESTGWGQVVADFDHDGRDDLFVGNGRVTTGSHEPGQDPYAETDQLFRGVAPARFREVSPTAVSDASVGSARAVLRGDLDDDGDLDLVIVNNGGRAHLLENIAQKRGGALVITLRDPAHRSLSGTIVRARRAGGAGAGPRVITRLVGSGGGYAAAHDPRVHIGTGGAPAVSLEVLWPDGTTEKYGSFVPGARPTLVRGSAR